MWVTVMLLGAVVICCMMGMALIVGAMICINVHHIDLILLHVVDDTAFRRHDAYTYTSYPSHPAPCG